MELKQLKRVLEADCGLASSDRLVLGLSGGPDSLALLHALYRLGFHPVVAHLDHALRPESAREAQAVEAMARELKLPFHSRREDVAALANTAGQSLEEAAREARYRFLFEVAEAEGAGAVAVAHTADDQVETVLMHLLRGAGTSGLAGMEARSLPNPWSETVALVRPLLGTWRAEIEDLCVREGLQPLRDASNQDTTFFRNRLRHELIPTLESYNPGIKRALLQSAEILRADRHLLEQLAAEAWPAVLRRQGDGYLGLDRSAFREQPLALQRLLLRSAFAALRPAARDLDFEAVARARNVFAAEDGKPQDWAAGLILLAEEELVWVAEEEARIPVDGPQLAPGLEVAVEVPAVLELGGGWQFRAEAVPDAEDIRAQAIENRDPYQAWLDRGTAGEQLTLRTRRPGDRFQPLGLEVGSQKLADFMINARLPARARAGWPLLCRGDEILWVPGLRIAQGGRLRPESRAALHLQVAQAQPAAG